MNLTDSTRATALLGGAIAIVSFGLGVAAWSSLPEQVVVHWDAGGAPDGTAPKAVGAFGLPALAAALLGLLLALPRIDPLGANLERFRDHYHGFVLLFVAALAVIQATVLAFNLGYEVDVGTVVLGVVGVVLAYAGVLLRESEPNWFVGIRTPWTLSSETVWERTHALGGTLFVLAGIAIVLAAAVAAVVGSPDLVVYVVLGATLTAALVPAAYSWYCYESLDQPDDRPRSDR